ncbi:DUF2474 family protein [Tropicibacter alexandrii]|nr:DUF2474 family protein [Tropicibacter alexandrii]
MPPLLRKWAWFIGLWLASVVVLGVVAWVIRLAI